MKTIVNFSHPISQSSLEILTEALGDDVNVVDIPVRLEPSQPFPPQIDKIMILIARTTNTIDYIVLPGLSAAAVLLAQRMPAIPIIRFHNRQKITFDFQPIEIITNGKSRLLA
jgi:hypothetical protein